MNILITIVMDKTNYRCMAQHSGPTLSKWWSWTMTMTQLSHSVPTLPHLIVPTLPTSALFVKINITE